MTRKPFRADYTYTIEGNVIAIVDLDLGSKSVTNDIENVLRDIRAELGDLAGFAVIYRDSMADGTEFALLITWSAFML